ncbi:cytochrome c oxidase, cbb3-type, CcoQ subunit [Hydrogenimonas thermophila]|uniref:Cytochrome c oxidase cbb3-type subunit 4 n=1 Tax=Hydrogenimonas thermophila TaxID=223786 RepID=A0A1I5L7B5_9BACT|nr:cytochrome c oxidase, cbb3-type, CcoQ subunit [Hydrogenimonas thermophila]WOE70085.1 cytochrome c oxidase, cbb3-type, CcoQ subunit [Hydrogenimonas thermophila]WOE72602.1 cytochrome c oxidase, cbb3-type, CcoQ subunit [Hydrogenimonas thermophila]SFO93147.1 cytochrome c oxidase cbb3-type subunit 4 [Hydrogenimonas thermophila]
MENIRELQAYAYFFFTVFLTVILYAYILHLYRAEKKGTRNYEKYGKLALDDELDSAPVEPKEEMKENKEQS